MLSRFEVKCVITGSVAAAAYGVPLTPSDLDVSPETNEANLARIAALLRELAARPKFHPGWAHVMSREACERWAPDPPTLENLDQRFATPLGELDIVPSNSGRYDELAPRAITVNLRGSRFSVACPEDVVVHWKRWNRPRDLNRLAALEQTLADDDRACDPAAMAARLIARDRAWRAARVGANGL